jgi:hypothetical protein
MYARLFKEHASRQMELRREMKQRNVKQYNH